MFLVKSAEAWLKLKTFETFPKRFEEPEAWQASEKTESITNLHIFRVSVKQPASDNLNDSLNQQTVSMKFLSATYLS